MPILVHIISCRHLWNLVAWLVGVWRLFVTVMDISRPCQPDKWIPLLPWPGFDPSFSGHHDRRAIISEWTRLRLRLEFCCQLLWIGVAWVITQDWRFCAYMDTLESFISWFTRKINSKLCYKCKSFISHWCLNILLDYIIRLYLTLFNECLCVFRQATNFTCHSGLLLLLVTVR